MFILLFHLQMHIHKNLDYFDQQNYIPPKKQRVNFSTINSTKYYKPNKINRETRGCGSYNSMIGTQTGWYDNANTSEYVAVCHNGILKLSGPGIYKVKSMTPNLLTGLINVGNSDFECMAAEIYASGAVSSQVQLINLQGTGKHTILGTTFEFCGFHPQSNDNLPEDWDPSLIYISGSSTNKFDNIAFTHPDEGNPQPYIITGTRPIRIEGDCSLQIIGSRFYNSSCYTEGSFLFLSSTQNITISDCDFKKCYSIQSYGSYRAAQAIYITEENKGIVNIDGCTFTDCGKENKGYTVKTRASGLIFKSNTITFPNPLNSSGCIFCMPKGKFSFIDNTFINAANNDNQWVGACIYIIGQTSGYYDDEDLEIEGNIFDNIQGNNQGRCISADLKDGLYTTLRNNYFRNCPIGGLLIKIMQRTRIHEFNIENCEFNNNSGGSYGGGSGIWIENLPIDDFMVYSMNFSIVDCRFKNNYCFRNGGGFQIGQLHDNYDMAKFVINIEVLIHHCDFINNTSQESGGAVSIQTVYPAIIKNCLFKDNKSQYGGTIYISSSTMSPNNQISYASIDSCVFEGNSGGNSHCIYIGYALNISVIDCDFSNNHDNNYESGSCILSNASKLTVDNCKFINDDIEHSCGGINVTDSSILEVFNSDFIKCSAGKMYDSYGGAIGYASSYNYSRTESITINDCTFDGNKGYNGAAIFLKPMSSYPQISDIIIKNHNLTGLIFCIIFQFKTEGEFELNAIRFDNNTCYTERDDEFVGGPGIWITEDKNIDNTYCFNLVFDSCEFLYNHSPTNGGVINFGENSTLQSIELTFKYCSFVRNSCDGDCGGAIFIGNNKNCFISDCEFRDNFCGGNGKTLYITGNSTNVIISKCTFLNSKPGNGSQIYIDCNSSVEISSAAFQSYDPGCKSRAIELTDGSLNVHHTFFVNFEASDPNMSPEGNAILVNRGENEAIIEDNEFRDCYTSNQLSYIVTFNGSKLNFCRNSFFFIKQNGCGCLRVYTTGNVVIEDNEFRGVNVELEDFYGVFIYEETERTSSDYYTIIRNNIFDICQNDKQISCFYFKWKSQDYHFVNNTFKQCDFSNGIGKFDFMGCLNNGTFHFEKNRFLQNHGKSPFGGGSGIIFQNKGSEEFLYENHFTIVIDEGYFDSNSASNYESGNGGALQIGWDESYSNIDLEIVNSSFISNQAYKEGGALFLMIQGNIEIFDCKFIGNFCRLSRDGKNYGGAIAIKPNCCSQQNKIPDSITINKCSFIGNYGPKTNSIYINNAQETEVIIGNQCYFVENSTYSNSHSSIITDSCNLKIDDCSFEFSSISLLSGEIESDHSFSIQNCVFCKSCSGSAIQLQQTNGLVKLFSLTNCEFENCVGSNASCLSLNFISNTDFVFKDNVIRYTNETVLNKYLYSFCFTNKASILIENVSFINIESECLYGGGTGVWITGVDRIIFDKCLFNNNTAIQAKNGESRPNLANKAKPYYNGDGGGFQYGYSESLYDTEIEIRNCSFKNNKANRHGGGLALQTTKKIIIVDCIFEENTANKQHSKSRANLLFDNYFDLKTEGRGGAIYINPAFSHPKKPDDSFMSKIEITNSTFKSNTAFDGCAIYVEGDDAGTEFIIQQNKFIDNHNNDENLKSIRKGIITSEINNLFDGKIETSNEFTNTNPLIDEVLYVDHYGKIPSDQFTVSFVFTQSQIFSESKEFKEIETEKIVLSKSFVLVYTRIKSVSYSISYFESNTFVMSFNSINSTYDYVLQMTNYYDYFPYIIYYMSPSYIQTMISLKVAQKRGLTQEQLIGVTCGTASVFFLVLGIIILAIQKRNQDKLKYLDFDDISSSSEFDNKNIEENKMPNNETEQFDQNEESIDNDTSFWL